MTITFHGAAETVTGSKHLLTLADGKKILLDCGMFQGHGAETDSLNRNFGFYPQEIDMLILSHAHIDHSGLIPKLVKEGFKGKIICTPATFDLCKIMLTDSAHIQESDIFYLNKKREERNQTLLNPLYTTEDVEPALELFETVEYNQPAKIYDDVELLFIDAGHILGSATVNLKIREGNKTTRFTFTGDIGRYCNRILRDPQPIPQADYVVCESTYGNKIHEPIENAEAKLLQTVRNTCVNKKGKLIIPAFSIGRTQEIINALNILEFAGKLPPVKVFIDSPLSINATEIVKTHQECFRPGFLKSMKKDHTPFDFENLIYVNSAEESKKLNDLKEPCIIISASGMAEAGRVKHHLKNNLENPRNTVMIVGWCAEGTLGNKLVNHATEVSIFGYPIKVKAEIVVMNSFSAHGDYKEMLRFLDYQEIPQVKKVFLVHGEKEVLPKWKDRLLTAGFHKVVIPRMHETLAIGQ